MSPPFFSPLRKFFPLLWTVAFLFCPAALPAQEEGGGGRPVSFWKAVLPDGEYVVPHHMVSSFSFNRYVVNGVLRVYEVSVDTVGSVQAKFYYLEEIEGQSPVGLGQSAIEDLRSRVREVQERTGTGHLDTEVSKTHPTTTHAHTVEFMLPSLETLQRLHSHLEDSWTKRITRTFRLEP